MKRRFTAVVSLASCGAVAIALAATLGPAPSKAAPPAQSPSIGPAQATQIALARAADAGDAGPGVSVASESAQAARASMHAPAGPASAEGESSVYLVTLHGSFTLGAAHVPKGLPAPRGNVMQVAVDASGQVVWLHLGSEG